MKPITVVKIQHEESRKRRREAERRRRQEALRRRREQDARDHKRRLRWLIMLWLLVLESIPTPSFSRVIFGGEDPRLQKRQRQPQRLRKSRKKDEFDKRDDPVSDYDRHYLFDHRPRRGEEGQEVYDGLTWADIVAYNRIHRPWLFPVFKPIPGMPKRYADEPAHVWTLLFEMQYPHARQDAIAALKLIVDESAWEWIDACSKGVGDLTWKDIRGCRRRTPDATLLEFPRAATRWREDQRREAEERKREVKETPSTGPKPPGAIKEISKM